MTQENKIKLVSLLHEYMAELAEWTLDERPYLIGTKTQYEHARVLSTKLAKQVNDGIKPWL